MLNRLSVSLPSLNFVIDVTLLGVNNFIGNKQAL